jgi:hypothetical protein
VTEDTMAAAAGSLQAMGSGEIPQKFLPAPAGAARVSYTPYLYGAARIQFSDKRRGVYEERQVQYLLALEPGAKTVEWDQAKPTDVTEDQLLKDEPLPGERKPLPASATKINVFTRWAKQFDRWLARTQRVILQSKSDPSEPVEIRPKRGGVSVSLVAIVWKPSVE